MAVATPRNPANQIRIHDYLYDSSFVVSGARDFARAAFRAAMASAQINIQPIYKAMFSEVRGAPRYKVAYYPNCRLPDHMDTSYYTALRRAREMQRQPTPDLGGKDRFRFFAMPRAVLPLNVVEPSLHSGTPERETPPRPGPPVSRRVQTMYRESSAQTRPWQPDAKVADGCTDTPETLYLDKMEWGSPHLGEKHRTGDLPVDFHTTEIINKMRHTRKWTQVMEYSEDRNLIIADLETGDWLFREAEIDELQSIRLELLGEEVDSKNNRRKTRVQSKLHKLWGVKKQEMRSKIDAIYRNRDREMRKLRATHSSGGREALAGLKRSARGGGDVSAAAADPASELHAPLTRNGYQARGRNAVVLYSADMLCAEERDASSEEPAWLTAAREAEKSAYAPRISTAPCDKETRFGEQFLKTLHMSLKEARLGAGRNTLGSCKVLVPRRDIVMERPKTPTVEAVGDQEEREYQAALAVQRIIRGRAVQMLMADGCARAAQLTAELRTTHGLRLVDKERVRKQQELVRDLAATVADKERKEYRVSSLGSRLSGEALSKALDFLEKELRRLKDERRQHAFILVAKREKEMREAAEAGRRQLEERRRREHDIVFKQVVGVTQETVDAYLCQVIQDGAAACAESEAAANAEREADQVERDMQQQSDMSELEQNQLVAELVHQLALPEVQRSAARARVQGMQRAGLQAIRSQLFSLTDQAVVEKEMCIRCGRPLADGCQCRVCPLRPQPQEIPQHRDDPRWAHIRRKPRKPTPDIGERFPPHHDFRCMLDCLVDEAVEVSRAQTAERAVLRRDGEDMVKERMEATLDCRSYVDTMLNAATGSPPPMRSPHYRHLMYRKVMDAIQREEKKQKPSCPALLPSEIRRKQELEQLKVIEESGRCGCKDSELEYVASEPDAATGLLPSQIRALEELRRCKCDLPRVSAPTPSIADVLSRKQDAASRGASDDRSSTPPESRYN